MTASIPTEQGLHPRAHRFMFTTGIENSYPVIVDRDGNRIRRDQIKETGHDQHWRQDFALVKEMGLEYLRYGPAYYRVHQAPGKYDWSLVDEPMAELQRLGITPIVDLCHFGVPDWAGDFQNPDWPELFAEYAGAYAERYPWAHLYTPVNEIFITANFSGLMGWWNERLTSHRGFVIALKHLAKATLLAEEAILRVQPAALFVQAESTEYFHAAEPEAQTRSNFHNQRRFLSLDLCYGHDVTAQMYEYLLDNGMSKEEYHWLMEHGAVDKTHCIMGNDYYITNEHLVPSGEEPFSPAGDIFGYYVITRQYFDRYHLPVMHTETNLADAERAPNWLRRQWANMLRLKDDGVPIIGFTWYSLTDQVDWDTALRENNGNVNPLGLYDLDRKIRPVGEVYRKLVAQWRDILPAESLCLRLES
jgi:beta-glucosidase